MLTLLIGGQIDRGITPIILRHHTLIFIIVNIAVTVIFNEIIFVV